MENNLETSNNEEKEQITQEKIIEAMKDNFLIQKMKDNQIERQGNYEKCKFYKKNKQEITFRLSNHQEYFITGTIFQLKTNNEQSNNLFLINLKLKNGKKASYGSWEIDFETLIPSSYNPIRYFIRDSISKQLRETIFKRDNYECQLKLEGCTKVAEEIDHIIPISKGGLNNEDNLQASCSNCNKKKSTNILV